MFSKTTKAPEAASQARKTTPASLIAEGVLIRGNLHTADDLHLDGTIEGDVKVTRLTLGETGVVVGDIQAESIEIRGRVDGAITAHQVRMVATAKVNGDVAHAELTVEAGARFLGRSLAYKEPGAVDDGCMVLPLRSDERALDVGGAE